MKTLSHEQIITNTATHSLKALREQYNDEEDLEILEEPIDNSENEYSNDFELKVRETFFKNFKELPKLKKETSNENKEHPMDAYIKNLIREVFKEEFAHYFQRINQNPKTQIDENLLFVNQSF